MKIVAPILAAALALIGLIFIAGNQGVALRLVVGIVLLVSAVVLVAASRLRPQVHQRNIVQKIELSGDVRTEDLECRQCGASLSGDSVTVKAGAVFVSCPYCNAAYQLEEAPKW